MNIIELAKQAHGPITSKWWDMDVAALERFAALVRAQTLEEAVQKCDDLWQDDGTAYDCREAIRALTKEKT